MKEINKCKIIQDLLPNHIEDLTNEYSNELIEKHLRKCSDCKETFENMKKEVNLNEINEDKSKINIFKKINKKMKLFKTIILMIVIILLVIYLLVLVPSLIFGRYIFKKSKYNFSVG